MAKVKRVEVQGNINDYKMDNGNQIAIEWFPFDGSDATAVTVTKWEEMTDETEVRSYKVGLYKDVFGYIPSTDSRGYTLEIAFYGDTFNQSTYSEVIEISASQYRKPSKKYILDKVIKAIYNMESNKKGTGN